MKKTHNNNLRVLKALNFFVENPYDEIYLREFGRKLKISVNSAQRFLNLLLKQKFIVEYRRANLRCFKANLNSIVFRSIKIVFSLRDIEDSSLIDFLKENKFSQVVLFGSIAKGLGDSRSDIDLVCIGMKKVNISKFEKKLNRKINAHFFSLSEWNKTKSSNKAFYQDVIVDGISLIGRLPI